MIRFDLILKGFRKIFCNCEECGAVFRLSDTEIIADDKSQPDWLSSIDKKIELLEIKIERAEDSYRAKAEKIIDRERKNIERKTSRQVSNLVPNFNKIKLNMRDVKTIGYPVKFVSFDGKDLGMVKRIRFVDFEPVDRITERLFGSIDKSLKRGNVEWITIRVQDDGSVVRE